MSDGPSEPNLSDVAAKALAKVLAETRDFMRETECMVRRDEMARREDVLQLQYTLRTEMAKLKTELIFWQLAIFAFMTGIILLIRAALATVK